jgi:hypothetical protein
MPYFSGAVEPVCGEYRILWLGLEGILQGLKPPFLPRSGRPKAEALGLPRCKDKDDSGAWVAWMPGH